MSYELGVTAALGAGSSFAAAGVLQQRVAARTTQQSLSLGLLAALVRQPLWLGGIGLAALSYALQALALAAAPLVLVQPLLVTELVFAIPVSARLAGRRLRGREWAGLAAVAAGVAATVWGAAARGSGTAGTPARWLAIGGTLALAAVALGLIGRRRSPLLRASLFAAAAAVLFALSSALLAATVAGFVQDGIGGLTRPAPYGMAAASLSATLFMQSAFQAGPLSVAMPMVDWVEPQVAVLLGVSVLGESLDTRASHLTALAIGAVSALAGILTLDSASRAPAPAAPAPAVPAPVNPVPAGGSCCPATAGARRPARRNDGHRQPVRAGQGPAAASRAPRLRRAADRQPAE